MKKKLFLLFILVAQSLVFSIPLLAQFYSTGSAPYRVDWKQLKTKEFTIVYPLEWEASAIEFAGNLHASRIQNIQSFDSIKIKPIEIVCYNRNTLSNGYVSWAPSRMEIITTPPQSSYAQEWTHQLALHEYRHVLHVNAMNRGFTKALSWIFGEFAVGAMVGFLPLWYLEGDAVIAETALSNAGRGREPEFMKELKAIELNMKKRPSYDQAYLGSYKVYTPNHYAYGYQMVAWGKANYGNKLFNSALKQVANKPFTLAPFYLGLKKEAGLSKVNLYDSTFNYLKYSLKDESIDIRDSSTISQTGKFKSNWVSYTFPFITDSSVIALRTSTDDIVRLVELQNNKEKILYTLGSFYGEQLGFGKNLVAWEEFRSDLRFEQQNYSVIRVFDIKSHNSFILQNRERHFSPSISANDKLIAVIKNDLSSRSFLEIYSLATQEKIKSIEHPDNEQLSFNCWIDSSHVGIVSLGNEGKSIFSVNIFTNEWRRILGPVYSNISHLSSDGGQLFFTHTLSGVQEIYAYNFSDSSIRQLTQNTIANDFGCGNAETKKLVYSRYDIDGYKLHEIPYSSFKQTEIDSVSRASYFLADAMVKLLPSDIKTPDSLVFKTESYSRFKNTFNFHSRFLPFYVDVSDNLSDFNLSEQIHWGANFFTQNLLSSFTGSLGAYYQEGYVHFRPAIKYTGWYPVLSFDMDYGGAHQFIVLSKNVSPEDENFGPNLELNAEVSLPLRFNTSRFSAGITPAFKASYNNLSFVTQNDSNGYTPDYSNNNTNYYHGILSSDVNLGGYMYSKTSKKDILPRWGLNIYSSVLEPDHQNPYYKWFKSKILSGRVYLPGLFRHQSLRILLTLENGLNNRSPLPRGYNSESYNSFYSSERYAVDYTLPLLYPDISVGPLAYVKRIYGTVFFESMHFESYKVSGTTRLEYSDKIESAGMELYFDTHFLRFFVPLTPVVTYSYLLQEQKGLFLFTVKSMYSF